MMAAPSSKKPVPAHRVVNRNGLLTGTTLVARTIERRSIYDARLTDAEVKARGEARDPA